MPFSSIFDSYVKLLEGIPLVSTYMGIPQAGFILGTSYSVHGWFKGSPIFQTPPYGRYTLGQSKIDVENQWIPVRNNDLQMVVFLHHLCLLTRE